MVYIIKCNSYRLLKSKINELISNIEKDNITYFDYDETNMKNIIEECNYTSLFCDKKAIIVRNIPIFSTKGEYKEEQNLLEEYLKHENEFTTLIFITDSVSKTKKTVKLINNNNNYFDIPIPTNDILKTKIKEYLKSNNYKIENNALEKIIDNLNSNYDFILNELDKIMIVKKDYIINLNDVNKYSIDIKKESIFDFVDLIIKKDKKMYEYLTKFIKEKQEPAVLFANVATQYRLMYSSYYLSRNYSEKDIATMLDVHPYRVKLALNNSINYKMDEIKKNLLYIGSLDKKIKQGLIDKYIALKLFITSL